LHALEVRRARLEQHGVVGGAMQLDARAGTAAAADEEAGPGLFDREGTRGQRALGRVAELLVAADPVLAGVMARLAAARGRAVALDRLLVEGRAGLRPSAQIAGLEIERRRQLGLLLLVALGF